MFIVQCSMSNVHSTMNKFHCPLYNVSIFQCKMSILQCMMFIVQCPLYNSQSLLYNVWCLLYNAQCPLFILNYTVHCTMYCTSLQCTTVYCTLYIGWMLYTVCSEWNENLILRISAVSHQFWYPYQHIWGGVKNPENSA